MVMGAYSKTLFRMLKNNKARLLTLTAIIILGIAFITGLGAVSPSLKAAANTYYSAHNVPDIIIKSTSVYGFQDTNVFTQQDYIESFLAFTSFDSEVDGLSVRTYYLPLSDMAVNKIDLLSGSLPGNGAEALAERPSEVLQKKEIGDTISFFGQTIEITGIAANPLLYSKTGEQSALDGKDLDLILYFNSKTASSPFAVVTDIYIKLTDTENMNVYSNEYKNLVDEKITLLKQAAGNDDTFIFLTLRENKSAALLESYADKVQIISYFFPAFFLAVTILVVLATMSRFAEEERLIIGCYKTLGYGKEKIIFKYIFFSLICCITGCLAGLVLGNFTLMPIIYQSFELMFYIAAPLGAFYVGLGAFSSGLMLLSVLAVTLGVMLKLLSEKPATLLRQKAPKRGKKIFLEKIPFIWEKLKFKYKSSFRNIFRYPGHFIMTIVSVAGSTTLVLAGLALFNAAASAEAAGSGGMFKSLGFISLVIIVFAALLNVLVIYNLTNMNIAERKREISTLKVLGYKSVEVAGYIFREILILSLFGIAIGLPVGYFFIDIVFSFIEFGSVGDIRWFSWVITFSLSIIFILIVDAMLYRKITRTNMLESLKFNE